jgi:anaerobic selenocysteine-containing dehydrogenase
MSHHRACNLCEAMCGVVIETDGDRVTDIRGDENDPFSRGHICPKATALGDIHHDPDRLKRPLRRKGRDFEEIGWDEAFDEVAGRLREIRDRHGKYGVAVYQGNPSVHNWGQMLFGQLFVKALKSRSMYSATSVDQLPKMLASLEMFGNQLAMTVPDVDRTSLFIVFGANPLVSNGSIMSAPGMKRRIEAIKARSGKVIVFDPRRTETAEIADEHFFVKPSSDAFVLFGMVHVLFEEGLVNLGRFRSNVTGLETLRELAAGFAPEASEAATGVPATDVRRIARLLAGTPRAVVYGRVGVSMQQFGGLASWLIEALNVLTGHFDEIGGAMFTTPAIDVVGLFEAMGQRGHHAKWRTRVRSAPEFGGELPVSCLAEEMETPGDGQVRALVTFAGNPVLSTPNGTRLERAIEKLDFMASVDIYVNETTRHANIILPPTFALEHDNYDVALATFAVRNVAKYSPALFERTDDQRHDYEIIVGLASRLMKGQRVIDPLVARLMRTFGGAMTPKRLASLLVHAGPHGLRAKGLRGLSMSKIEASTHGLDLGPLESVMPARLREGQLVLAPESFVADVPRLREHLGDAVRKSGGLVLIGRRQLRSNNSWCHNSPRLAKGKDRCTLILHPDDAAAHGIGRGDQVRVVSRVGEVTAPVEVSDEVMRGVVSLPHGFGHARGGRLRVADAKPGVSINDVTDEQRIDPLSGVADFGGVPVRIERVVHAAE